MVLKIPKNGNYGYTLGILNTRIPLCLGGFIFSQKKKKIDAADRLGYVHVGSSFKMYDKIYRVIPCVRQKVSQHEKFVFTNRKL